MNLEEIGKKIKAIRIERGFSLASLAQRSGISKSALFGIEESRVNPTINSLWSVATALGIAFGELVHEDSEVQENDLSVKLIEKNERFEIYKMIIANHYSKITAPHAFGTTEEIFVISGEMRVGKLDHPITLHAGEKGNFKADVPHMYQALSVHTVALVTISYGANEQKYFYEDRFVENLDTDNIEVFHGELENGIKMLRIIPSKQERQIIVNRKNLIMIEDADGIFYLTMRSCGVMAALYKILRKLGAHRYIEMVQKIYYDKMTTFENIEEKMLYSEISLLRGDVNIPSELLLNLSLENYTKQNSTSFERRISVGLYSIFEYFHPGYILQGVILASFLNKIKEDTEGGVDILDIGSGPGQHIRLINAFSKDLTFTCIEPSAQASAYLKNIDNVSQVISEEFDHVEELEKQRIIISVGSSHHLKLKSFLERSFSLLEKGGYLIVCDEFIAPFVLKEERARNLILHHTRYILDTMVPIYDEDKLSPDEYNIYKVMRHSIPHAHYLALHGEVEASSMLLYETLNKIRDLRKVTQIIERSTVYYIFMILELEALVAGLDYEEERKTSAKHFIHLAEDLGYTLQEYSCFYPTSEESGTYFIVLQK